MASERILAIMEEAITSKCREIDAEVDGLVARHNATIATLTAENERLSARVARLEAALKPLLDAATGLSFGEDWNNGTQAKLHGYRQKLIAAIPAARRELEEGK